MRITWIKVAEAATLLGVTEGEVRLKAKAGDLRSTMQKGVRGRAGLVIAREDVEFAIQHAKKTAAHAPSPSFAERYTPEDAKRVFEALKRKMSIEDIVITLNPPIHPTAVLAISRVHDQITGRVTLEPDHVTALRKLGLDVEDPLPDADTFVEAVALATKEHACSCGRRAVRCQRCLADAIRAERKASLPHANGAVNGALEIGADEVRSAR